MANGTITREEYREKIFPNITNLGAMGGDHKIDDPMFYFAMSLNTVSIVRDIEKLLFGDEDKKEG